MCLIGSGQPYIYGVHTVSLAGKSPYIRSYTVCLYSSGQPYACSKNCNILCRLGQNRTYAPCKTVSLVISLSKIPYTVGLLVVLRLIKLIVWVPRNVQYIQKKLRKFGPCNTLTLRLPISGCSLQVLGSNPCQNVLSAIHPRLYAVSNEVTQGSANPLTDKGYNREQSMEVAQKLANSRQL